MKILVVDDESRMIDLCCRTLLRDGHQVSGETNPRKGLEALRKASFDAVLSDMVMPDMDGMEFMAHAKEICPEVAFVYMTAFSTVESAVEAMKSGARDYISKPFRPQELRLLMQRLERELQLESDNRYLRIKYESDDMLIQSSESMKKIVSMAEKAAATGAPVLITGPSGSGKERLAKLVHSSSSRAERPLITVNCGAIPADLMESELFGHVAGAFTDAQKDRRGMFRLADRGTLFLDEIGDLKLELQVKLLRALEEKTIRPVGAEDPVQLDVRVISATNCDLEAEVAAGNFREDLYFRLNVIRLDIPPLSERPEDLKDLIRLFLHQFSRKYHKVQPKISEENMNILLSYHWPGNVRELGHVIERALILQDDTGLSFDELQSGNKSRAIRDNSFALPRAGDDITLSELELAHIRAVLDLHKGNRTQAASILGIDKSTLWRKLKRCHCR